MGVKGLSKFLKQRCPSYTGCPVPKGSGFLAIDVPLFLHRYIFSVGPIGLIKAFHMLRESVLTYGYRPIWVFDGTRLPLKDAERQRRSAARQSFSEGHVVIGPTNDDHERVISFCRQDDVKFAKYEAEALCAYLVASGVAFAALTHDTDVFAYACPRTILNVSTCLSQGTFVLFESLLSDLSISKETFQKACVLCGNDFCLNEKNVGPVRAFTQTDTLTLNQTVLELFQTFCYQDKCLEDSVPDDDQRTSKRPKLDSPNSLCKPGSPNESHDLGLLDKAASRSSSPTGPTFS
jgi:hypothetical protein